MANEKESHLFCCEFISHIIYRSLSGGMEVGGYMVVCFFIFFAAGHIMEAASKHQIHLFVRFVTAIFIML